MKIISVTGYKKSGKTTLVERLVQELAKRGSVGTVKHMPGHDLNPDGTDTRRYMDAGARAVMGVTHSGTAKFIPGTDLGNALDELANSGMDYAVVEGFKDSRLPKIVLGDLELPDEVARLDSGVDLPEKVLTNLLDIIEQQPEYHTLDSLITKVRQNPRIAEAGAIGSFTGIVREKTGDVETKSLEFESYEEETGNKIRLIETDLKACEGILDVRIHHRVGRIEAGQDILYIVVAASHRQQLFQALSDAIERVKAEVPIWKKEHTTTGEFWVQDHP
ncbi:MAG: molybdopterin synthase [ANME-2 cluster archaeon]|jgi:molybdopterin synthase catalytic subunit|nr:molybdopterin synthase [ANME-2 cluster archaeon]